MLYTSPDNESNINHRDFIKSLKIFSLRLLNSNTASNLSKTSVIVAYNWNMECATYYVTAIFLGTFHQPQNNIRSIWNEDNLLESRSCKRSDTKFQKSLLLFLTWREYFYFQPTHFSSQPKKLGFKQSSAPFTRPWKEL